MAHKTINLNKNLNGLGGDTMLQPDGNGGVEAVSINKTLATIISRETKGDVVKLTDWAFSLYKGEAIILDASDLSVIKSIVNNSTILNVLSKRQILDAIDA